MYFRFLSCRGVAVIAGAFIVAACSDTQTTAPMARAPLGSPNYEFGNPPPPPIETTSSALVDGFQFSFQATYFLNGPGLNGFISFSKDQPAGVSISPNARISFHQGVVSGKGTIQLSGPGVALTIDLANGLSSDGAQFNHDCGNGCGSVPFQGLLSFKDGKSRIVSGVLAIGASQTHTTGF